MKIDNLRPGMVFEKIKTAHFKQKSKTPIKEDLYEVVKVENNDTSGYSMTAIWMGHLTTNEGCMVDLTTINNPGEWKHHDNAFVTEKHQIVKQGIFVDRDPYIIIIMESTFSNLSGEMIIASVVIIIIPRLAHAIYLLFF